MTTIVSTTISLINWRVMNFSSFFGWSDHEYANDNETSIRCCCCFFFCWKHSKIWNVSNKDFIFKFLQWMSNSGHHDWTIWKRWITPPHHHCLSNDIDLDFMFTKKEKTCLFHCYCCCHKHILLKNSLFVNFISFFP